MKKEFIIGIDIMSLSVINSEYATFVIDGKDIIEPKEFGSCL
jgi:hypothetical protein